MERNQFKIYRKRAARQSFKFLADRRRRNLSLTILILAAFSTWTYDISKLTRLDALTIQTVSVEGTDKDTANSLAAAAFGAIRGDYLGLFSKSNALLYSKTDIEESMKDASPRIDSAAVSRNGLRSLAITVREKTPAAVVCVNLPDFNSGAPAAPDSCFFADSTGMPYMLVATSSDKSYNRYYISEAADGAGSNDAIGSYVIVSSTFKSLQDFYDGLRSARIEPRGILVKNDGEYELYAANPVTDNQNNAPLPTSDTVVIYFDENNGLKNELSNLISFWSHFVTAAQTKNESLSFDSIDLRYGSNVSYRLSK